MWKIVEADQWGIGRKEFDEKGGSTNRIIEKQVDKLDESDKIIGKLNAKAEHYLDF